MTRVAAQPGHRFDRFQIGPVDLAVRAVLPDVMDDLRRLYAPCHRGELDESDLDLTTQMVIEARPDRVSLPLRRRYTIVADGEPLFTHRQAGEVLPYMEWAVNNRYMTRGTDHLQFHASTVSWQGQGVAFAASSGSGKSTLAAVLLAGGWQYLCDEFALIHRESKLLQPFPKAICVKEGSFDVVRSLNMPLLAREHFAKAYKGRVGYVSPHAMRRDAVSGPVPMRMLVFPRYTGTDSPTLRPMHRAEAMMLLSTMSFNRGALGSESMELLTDVLGGASCYRLEVGAPARTRALLESALSEADRAAA